MVRPTVREKCWRFYLGTLMLNDALRSRWADDTTGPTIAKTVKIEVDMLDWLNSIDVARATAKHIRAALRDYRGKVEKANHAKN